MSRLPPQNIEAEQSILGGLMLEPGTFEEIGDNLAPEDFYSPAHGKIFQTIIELQIKSQPIDLITVSNSLSNRGELVSIGGTEYLVEILSKTVSAANIESYARIVKDKAMLRRIIATSSSVSEKAFKQDFVDVESFVDEVEGEFFKLAEKKTTSGLVGSLDIVSASLKRLEELYGRQEEITGIGSGFADLDRMTAGLQPSELIIIAARPSMGKTALSLNIAQHIALRGKKTVAYFSLEMPKEAVMMRLLASEAKIDMEEIRTGKLQDASWTKLIQAAGSFSDSKLFIDDTSAISPLEVRARVRRLKAQHDVDCIVIDYLQLMTLKRHVESREREVSEISRTLKALAKELRIPIIALAQLNRLVENRADRRPMLSDLRESGSIEQDADVIMMLYREDYYDREDPEKKGAAELIIGKQRNGPTGTVKLKWESKFGRFRDADPQPIRDTVMRPSGGTSSSSGTSTTSNSPQSGYRPKNFAPGARN